MPEIIQEGPVRNDAHKAILEAPYTSVEVNQALSVPGCKALGLDEFSSHFYKDSWSIVGDEVVADVLDSLNIGKILKELNNKIITLIPKTAYPKNVTKFRPISCCNTF